MSEFFKRASICTLMCFPLFLFGCGGGGSSDSSNPTIPPTPNTPTSNDTAFADATGTARFLTQATFGATPEAIDTLTNTSASQWFIEQINLPTTSVLPRIAQYKQLNSSDQVTGFEIATTSFIFWHDAVAAQDQLRQRMAFALSQILVVSSVGGEILQAYPEGIAYYMDTLLQGSFGNYRDLLEKVTYSPAMGYYLTYRGNQKANPETGRTPDENYARELLQLFSIGLVELNPDGSIETDENGDAIELYDNQDITELAKVFTGLEYEVDVAPEDPTFPMKLADALSKPMKIIEPWHSTESKSFLGLVIPENTDAATSIDLTLDHIMAQPSIGPFIGRQLIQRFVTSHPQLDYIERVASAFDQGSFELPNGEVIGTGEKGDLTATLAAVLFDPQARESQANNSFGKIREPVIRFTNWARAFGVSSVTPELTPMLWDTSDPNLLAQHPYRANSVFNFYRPGYIAPATQTGNQNLTIPELQIMNATSTPGYINFMSYFIGEGAKDIDLSQFESDLAKQNIFIDVFDANNSFIPDYGVESSLSSDPVALVNRINLVLCAANLSTSTQTSIVEAINLIPNIRTNNYDGPAYRVFIAILMAMTSPDYLVQR